MTLTLKNLSAIADLVMISGARKDIPEYASESMQLSVALQSLITGIRMSGKEGSYSLNSLRNYAALSIIDSEISALIEEAFDMFELREEDLIRHMNQFVPYMRVIAVWRLEEA